MKNYKLFRANLGTPLVAAELSFDGNFELDEDDADILIQISGGAIIWQKERLLNLAIKSVPADVNTIAWVDCDVIFERLDWVDAANEQLKELNVVQLYSDLVDLHQGSEATEFGHASTTGAARGAVSLIHEKGLKHADIAPLLERGRAAGGQSMGLAWAAKRRIMEDHGLYDAMIAGAGDRALVGTMYGQIQKVAQVFEFNNARAEHYFKWARPYYEDIDERIGFIPGRIFHLWHGELANRKTLERHRLLARFGLEPDADLVVGANGAWQWKRSRPDLEEFFVNYFKNRAEDG